MSPRRLHEYERDGLTFHVRDKGPHAGSPVILLHGFPETSGTWDLVTPALANAGYRVLAPDQRGYSPGARSTAVADYATDVLADDAIAIADALGIDRFHLVGHDWGAAISWMTATRHPDRLLSLTALSVPHLAPYGAALVSDPDQRERASYIGLFRQGRAEDLLLENGGERLLAMYGDAVPVDQAAAYLAHLSEPGALTAALSWYRAMTSDLASLPPVTVPTTYVWSDDDMAIGRVPAERCGDHVTADYRFVELAGVSHWIPEEAPSAAADAIISRVTGR